MIKNRILQNDIIQEKKRNAGLSPGYSRLFFFYRTPLIYIIIYLLMFIKKLINP